MKRNQRNQRNNMKALIALASIPTAGHVESFKPAGTYPVGHKKPHYKKRIKIKRGKK